MFIYTNRKHEDNGLNYVTNFHITNRLSAATCASDDGFIQNKYIDGSQARSKSNVTAPKPFNDLTKNGK